MLVCQTSHFADLGLRNPVWSTGQYILDHHRQHLPSLEALDAYRNFTAPGKLRVLIVARHHRSRVRQLLNQQQVWSWCTKFRPAAGVLAKVPAWNGTSCLLHQPGADHLLDTALAAQADVMVGVHGAGLLDALYMRPGSSVVEVRPRGFAGAWPNAYLKDLLGSYDDHPLFWWGINIVQPEASKPGELEQQQRGAPDTWPRDRHVTLRLMALQYIFERIVLARRDRGVYLQLRKQRETYITDDMRNLGEDD